MGCFERVCSIWKNRCSLGFCYVECGRHHKSFHTRAALNLRWIYDSSNTRACTETMELKKCSFRDLNTFEWWFSTADFGSKTTVTPVARWQPQSTPLLHYSAWNMCSFILRTFISPFQQTHKPPSLSTFPLPWNSSLKPSANATRLYSFYPPNLTRTLFKSSAFHSYVPHVKTFKESFNVFSFLLLSQTSSALLRFSFHSIHLYPTIQLNIFSH